MKMGLFCLCNSEKKKQKKNRQNRERFADEVVLQQRLKVKQSICRIIDNSKDEKKFKQDFGHSGTNGWGNRLNFQQLAGCT